MSTVEASFAWKRDAYCLGKTRGYFGQIDAEKGGRLRVERIRRMFGWGRTASTTYKAGVRVTIEQGLRYVLNITVTAIECSQKLSCKKSFPLFT